MEFYFSRKEKIVGVFVIGIILLLLSVVIIIGRGKDWFQNYGTYYTVFDESYNLQVNSPVKLFKTDVGKVKQIMLVGDKVRVKLAILEQYTSRIRTDTIVIVESPTLIGSEFISIVPGTKEKPLIEEGGEIQSEKKKSLSDIIAEYELEKTAKMIIPAIQDFAELVQELRDPNGPIFTALDHLNNSLSNIDIIVQDVERGKGTVGNLLRTKTLIDSIQNSLSRVDKILNNVNLAAVKAPGAMDQVQDNLSTIKTLGTGLTESVEKVNQIMSEVSESIAKLKIIMSNIEKGSYDVPPIIQSTKEGVNEIRDAVENIDKVVESLKQNFLIKPNLPADPVGENTDADLR